MSERPCGGHGIYARCEVDDLGGAPPTRVGPTTWLVGERNPYGGDPYYALYPEPAGCSGARLCAFLGLTGDEYLRRFERRNLLDGPKWSLPRAREAAGALLAEVAGGDRLVLLGAKVARAFGYDFEALAIYEASATPLSLEPAVSGPVVSLTAAVAWVPRTTSRSAASVRVLIAPHPSGMNRAWSDPGLPARLRAALAELEGAA